MFALILMCCGSFLMCEGYVDIKYEALRCRYECVCFLTKLARAVAVMSFYGSRSKLVEIV
jgi:hypothetical protein